jgi:hypothetical protein
VRCEIGSARARIQAIKGGGRRGKEDRASLGRSSAKHGDMVLVVRRYSDFVLFCFSRLCFTFLAAALQKRSGLSRLEFVRREADGFETLQAVPGRRGGMPTGLVSACVFQTFLLFLGLSPCLLC